MADSPKLDIWGSPTRGAAECFACGISYKIEDSNAPEDYQSTYCSWSCYNEDMGALRGAATTAPEVATSEQIASAIDNVEEIKVGGFRIKVRKDTESK